jgi:hypothetical protein
MTRHTDSLAGLLETTDAAFAPPSLQSDLAGAVRRRARRRSRVRAAGTVILLFASLGIAAMVLRHSAPSRTVVIQPPPSPATNPRELESQLRELRAKADTQHATLERWRRSHDTRRRLERVYATLAAAAPATEAISMERERAALILLDHADRLRRELKEEEAARAAYRRTIELFPDTRWAAVARQRMEQLPT